MRSFKVILSKVPVNVRVRFLESMSFSNGKLVNVRIGDLRGVLRKSDIQALMLRLRLQAELHVQSVQWRMLRDYGLRL